MKTKLIRLAVIITGFGSCLTFAAQPPKKVVETDPHWLAGDAGEYIDGPNGEHIWITNVDEYWQGVWKEDTNHWRVQLSFSKTNTPDVTVTIGLGSIFTNSGGGYFVSPDGKFEKFELLAPDGTIVPFTTNAAVALVRAQDGIFGIEVVPKTQWNGSFEEDFPQQIPVGAYPHFSANAIAGHFAFVSNGGPYSLGIYRLNDVYSITNKGDYTLTVRPVVYGQHPDYVALSGEQLKELLKKRGSYNIAYYEKNGVFLVNTNANDPTLYRMDLPSVSAKIHLMPSQ
jgi:hypothetical protein